MAIQSIKTVDPVAQTISLSIVQGANTIESIVYSKSSNSLLFNTVNNFSLVPADFITFTIMLDNLNSAIVLRFSPSTQLSSSFSVSQVSDMNDGSSILNFSYSKTNHPLYSITSTYPSGLCVFAKRNQPTTLLFNEWLYYHNCSLHFEKEIRTYYNL